MDKDLGRILSLPRLSCLLSGGLVSFCFLHFLTLFLVLSGSISPPCISLPSLAQLTRGQISLHGLKGSPLREKKTEKTVLLMQCTHKYGSAAAGKVAIPLCTQQRRRLLTQRRERRRRSCEGRLSSWRPL